MPFWINLQNKCPLYNLGEIFFQFSQGQPKNRKESELGTMQRCSHGCFAGGKSADETLPRPGHVRSPSDRWHHGHRGLKIRSCNVWCICLASLVHGVVNWFRFVKNTEPVDSSAGQRFESNINFPTGTGHSSLYTTPTLNMVIHWFL